VGQVFCHFFNVFSLPNQGTIADRVAVKCGFKYEISSLSEGVEGKYQ